MINLSHENIYGYMGKIALIDLSKNKVRLMDLRVDDCRAFIGGSGLGAKYLYEMVPPDVDPISPENVLIIMTGPMTGTAFPTSGRFAICAKSPLTNGWGEATAGGFWGAELKFAGLDGIIIRGRASEPVYIYIEDLNIQILKAKHLWNLDTYDVEDVIRSDHGDKNIKVLSIGRAGENLCRIAAIICDKGRAAARCGLGAVMGSKNLKAIAVRGTKKPAIAKLDELAETVKEVNDVIKESPRAKALRSYGTAGLVEVAEPLGDLPIKYWSKGAWPEGAKKISGQTMARTILKKPKACFACPIACGREIEVTEEPYRTKGKGPEYESIAALGSLCLVDSLNAIAKANELCNRYGLDTISTGSVIAFAIEAFEKGLITIEDTGGLKLRWGDPDIVLRLIDMIAKKEGFGAILAEGVKRAAEKIGKGAEELAVHVRGLEVAMHDPRAFASLALQYATMPRGACHAAFAYVVERGMKIPELGLDTQLDRFSSDNKANLVKIMQDYVLVFDSLVLCKFLVLVGVPPSLVARGLSAITGWVIDLKGLLTIGERIFNIKRAFNVRCETGFRKYDTLPKKLLTPLPEGGAKNHVPNLEVMLNEYYKLRGWTTDGVPTREKLIELNLHDVAKDLWGKQPHDG